MALINIDDLLASTQQNNNVQSNQQTQSTPQQYATQAAQMPTGTNTLPVQYTPKMMGVDLSLNPGLAAQQAKAQAQGEVSGKMAGGAPQLAGETAEAEARAKLPAQKEETLNTQRAQAIANLPAALRDIDVMKSQFDAAFPSSDNTLPMWQRIKGVLAGQGANMGIGVTPQQVGILKSMPLATIGLVRMAGALGRVTNFELQQGEKVTNMAGLTPAERMEVTRTLATQYMSRLDSDDWKELIKQSPDLPYVMKDLGVDSPIIRRALQQANPTQNFVVGGKSYDIPVDQVAEFKKEAGIK